MRQAELHDDVSGTTDRVPFAQLLSTDPRTAPLYRESGCRDSDSPPILEAIGSAKSVTVLARGRQGSDAVAVVVADDRVRVVTLGFRVNVGNAFRGTSNIRLDSPMASVTIGAEQPTGTLILQTATQRLTIDGLPGAALDRMRNGPPPAPPPQTAPRRRPHPATRPASAARTGPIASTWQQAEQLAVWHLRQLGFHDARATPLGADMGADVIATGAVAQVKHWSQPVGQPPLRDLFGVAQAAVAAPLFYSFSGYTAQAREWATATKTALFTYTIDGNVVAENAAAHDLGHRRSGLAGQSLGFFASARADRYRLREAELRREIDALTERMQRRTQSRRATARQAAGMAAGLLINASRTLDAGDAFPPADRRREDVHEVVREALTQAKRLL